MATARHVLALATFGDTDETVAALGNACSVWLTRRLPPGMPTVRGTMSTRCSGRVSRAVRPVMRPREAALAPSETVPLNDAVGRVAADIVCPYPPGIPVLCPGEQVSADAVAYLQAILHRGGEVRGLVGSPHAPAVRVVEVR